MSGRCPRIALFCLGFLLWSVPAWAEEASGSDGLRDRWIPALTFDVLLHDWEEEGSLDTSLPNCSIQSLGLEDNVCKPSLSSSGKSQTSAVQYRLGLDLMSPRIDLLSFIFSPRAWIFGGILINPKQTHPVMTSPSDGRFVPRQPEDEVNNYAEPGYPGVAAEIRSTYRETGWFVGVGSVFELPYRNSMFRIKVGVNYLRERVQVEAKLAAVKLTNSGEPGGPACTDRTLPPCEVVRASLGPKNQIYHYLGPVGELEMVLVPGRRFTFSIYGQTQFLWNLDPSNVVLSTNAGGSPSTFTYSPDDFAVRGAIGMRLAWAPRLGF